jgi:RHS repeat-associated protein
MDMVYDTIHNIQRKTQADAIIEPSGVSTPQKKVSYDFTYAYNASGSTSVQPHAPNHIGVRTYTYDLNGNQTGWTHDQNGTRRTITWDDENRIQAVFDNGHEKDYKYDDKGDRVIKRGPQGETVYVNQFYTQRPGATGTKHIYAGTTRIASKLVKQDTPNGNGNGSTPFEKDIYFFHPDHLGSSNYVTDINAKLYEHLEYFPFGEAWVEENSNAQRTPYLFSAKELDEETGLYYFGARYYDPRTSVWQSPDPVLGKYMSESGNGGVFRPMNLSLFSYSYNNPVRLVDPDGKWPTDPVHNDDTTRWATQVGMAARHAAIVGRADAFVDSAFSGKSWRPIIGDQSYHFNTNPEGSIDSREQRHAEHYASAVALGLKATQWRTAQGGFVGWFKNTISSIYLYFSLRELGFSLHPVQDEDAHIKEFVEKGSVLGIEFQYHRSPELGDFFKKIGKNDGGDYSDKADDNTGQVSGSRGLERMGNEGNWLSAGWS